jgi:hypothetical protein
MNTEPADPRIAKYRRRRHVLYFLVVVLAAAAAWIFRPHFHADPALIDPRLRALERPYSHVDATIIFDGGSVLMTITGADGQTMHFFIVNDTNWREAFIQPDPRTREGRSPVTNQSATIQELAAILSDHCEDWWDYSSMERLTGRVGDKLQRICVGHWDDLNRWWEQVKF